MSLAPNFDATSQVAITIPPDDTTHGEILYYSIEVARSCNGEFSTGNIFNQNSQASFNYATLNYLANLCLSNSGSCLHY